MHVFGTYMYTFFFFFFERYNSNGRGSRHNVHLIYIRMNAFFRRKIWGDGAMATRRIPVLYTETPEDWGFNSLSPHFVYSTSLRHRALLKRCFGLPSSSSSSHRCLHHRPIYIKIVHRFFVVLYLIYSRQRRKK